MSDISVKKFFLASHTCEGFFSLFNQLYYPDDGWFCYIIKGGPGTGKSTLMKKIAVAAGKKYSNIELIYCSSDPNSLDAVIIPEIKICIADGTAPHVLEPKYPGVSEKIINLGDYWSEKKLQKNSTKLIDLFEINKEYHEKSDQFLQAMGSIKKSVDYILAESVCKEKLELFTKDFLQSIFKNTKISKTNHEKVRLLDAITPHGHIFFENSITDYAKNIYIIEDKYEIISNSILQAIRSKAEDTKTEIVSFPSPFHPEHTLRAILIPETFTAFIAKNPKTESYAFSDLKNAKKINATKFLNPETLKLHRNILSLYEKTSFTLLNESIKNLEYALENHDDIEQVYISSMNHKQINKIADKLISAIL